MESPPLESLDPDLADGVRRAQEARKAAVRGSIEFTDEEVVASVASYFYEKAFELAPDDPLVLHQYVESNLSLGNALRERGDIDAAIGHYQEAAVDPDYPTAWLAYIYLGVCHLLRGDYDKAYEYTRLSIEKNPYNADGYSNLGQIELRMGNRTAAIAAYETSLEILPHAGAARGLSRIYADEGDHLHRALELARLAVSLDPGPANFTTLGWVYQRTGDLRQAEGALERAIDLDPLHGEALFRLGSVRLAEGRADDARDAFTRLIALGREDVYTIQARRKLEELR